jgi:hypothetical protein
MRRVSVSSLFVFFVCLGLPALVGCSSQFTGSLTGRDGDGTGPKPAAGQAQVTSLDPASVAAGSSAFTLTVTGLNFTPTTTVLWDENTSLTTTYVSSTILRAQVPISLIAKPGTTTIIPSPVGTFNFGANFTITVPQLTGNNSFSLTGVPVIANDMVWDQASQQLYLSISTNSSNQSHPTSVTALNPQSGALGVSVSTGNEPGKLAISSDGSYLYADLLFSGLIGTGSSVHRYSLPSLQSDIDIPLGSSSAMPYDAIDLAVSPSNAHSIVVTKGFPWTGESGGVVIYDDAVARPKAIPWNPGPGPINTLLWNPNGQSVYGTGNTVAGLYFMSVDSTGIQLQTKPSVATALGNLHYDSTTGLLYSDSGSILDPATGSVVGTFPLNTLQGGLQGFANATNPVMVPDGKLNIAYFFGHTAFGGSLNSVLAAYDLTHFTFLGAISIPNVSVKPVKILRWGNNGLAILTDSASSPNVYLVSGDFVTSPAL